MARKQLADLVVEETQREEPTVEEVLPESAEEKTRIDGRGATLREVVKAEGTLVEVDLSELPKYLRLVRREARLREDQVLDLDRLVLRLNRAKPPGAGERITANTLLRVAVDLLLLRQEELAGETEEGIKASLT